jgi:plasminogen activator inhibitor 1 RNA-binding protein
MFMISDSDKKLHQSWGGDDGVTELQAEEAATKDATVEQTGAVVEDNAWGASAPADDAWAAPAATDDAWAAPVSAPAEDSWGAPAADSAPADGDKNEGRRGREREPEEPDNTLTLDQYLQQQKDKGFSVPKLEARKANEGADDALWKGAVEIQKKDEDETAYFVGKVRVRRRISC